MTLRMHPIKCDIEVVRLRRFMPIYPQPPTPTPKAVTPIEPMTNGYYERDKDELVMHSRVQYPFNTSSLIKSALSSQKRGF